MPRAAALLLAGVLGLNALYAGAQSTSLFLPILDQTGPLSASEIGVGSDGRTTYMVGPASAAPTGSVDGAGELLIPVTVAEGPKDAVYSYSLLDNDVAVSCAINSPSAVCGVILATGSVTSTTVMTLPYAPTLVAFAGASTSGAASPTPAPSSGSSASKGPSQTSSSTSVSSTHTSGASSTKHVSAGLMSVVAAGLFLYLL